MAVHCVIGQYRRKGGPGERRRTNRCAKTDATLRGSTTRGNSIRGSGSRRRRDRRCTRGRRGWRELFGKGKEEEEGRERSEWRLSIDVAESLAPPCHPLNRGETERDIDERKGSTHSKTKTSPPRPPTTPDARSASTRSQPTSKRTPRGTSCTRAY
jgi:hypothetical protein